MNSNDSHRFRSIIRSASPDNMSANSAESLYSLNNMLIGQDGVHISEFIPSALGMLHAFIPINYFIFS